MNGNGERSAIERLLGLNWQTRAGGTLAAAGGVLATQCTGTWRIVGGVLLAVGTAWLGSAARDKSVTSAQMAVVAQEKAVDKAVAAVADLAASTFKADNRPAAPVDAFAVMGLPIGAGTARILDAVCPSTPPISRPAEPQSETPPAAQSGGGSGPFFPRPVSPAQGAQPPAEGSAAASGPFMISGGHAEAVAARGQPIPGGVAGNRKF